MQKPIWLGFVDSFDTPSLYLVLTGQLEPTGSGSKKATEQRLYDIPEWHLQVANCWE